MRSHRWGLIAVAALVLAGVLLGVTLISRREHEPSVSVTPTTTREVEPTPTPSPSPTATPTPTKSVTYTVQAGDTLSEIAQEHDISLETLADANDLANPDVLQIGQVLIIPRDESNTEPAPALTETPVPDASVDEESIVVPPTITPSGPPLVEIKEIEGISDLEAETVVLSNEGNVVSLEDWTLSSAADDPFSFPALTLFPQGEVRVHSTEGDDTPRDLYWGRTKSAWQEGKLVTLRDADGNVVDTYIVPQ